MASLLDDGPALSAKVRFDEVGSSFDFDFSSFFCFCSSHQPVPIRFSASFSSTQPIFFAAASASSAVSPSETVIFTVIN